MNSSKTSPHGGPVFFAAGFRPFFSAAGLYGLLAMLAWLALFDGWLAPDLPLAPSAWHGHEMLYGYAAAAFAGFLLTATPNWGGTPPLAGARLAGLFVLWLLGRALFWLSPVVPAALVAAVDLAFLPALLLVVVPSLLRAPSKRNRVFLVVFALLVAGNVFVHLDALGLPGPGASYGLRLALDVFALLIAMIGGRIVPSFTANWLAQRGRGEEPRRSERLDRLALLSLALMIAADLALPQSAASGAAAFVAALVNLLRLSGWRGPATRSEPLLWALHLGYLWLVLGLALKGLGDLGAGLPGNLSIHALTIGAIGTMTMAVMSRAALGHTGRALRAPAGLAAAYLLVSAAALVRIALPLAAPSLYGASVAASGLAWAAAFAVFSAFVVPICLAPRADGKPG